MFKDIKKFSRQGNKANEDFVGCSPSFIFAIDGSSSLSSANVMNEESDTRWFSQRLGKELIENLDQLSTGIKDIVGMIMDKLKIEFEANIEAGSKKEDLYPSASICVFRINGEMLEYFQLGDCTAWIEFHSGEFRVLHDNSVTLLDDDVVKHMVEISAAENISIKEAAAKIKPLLLDNRNKKNKSNGYWILDVSKEGLAHSITENFSMKDISNIAVMTDGFADLCHTFKMFDNFQELNKAIEHTDVNDLVSALFEMQEKDLDMCKYPRIKVKDDTSLVWARVL